MSASRKDEAVRAILHVITRLADGQPLDPLARRLAVTTLEHAVEQVQAIQELKRARRAAKGAA